MFLPVPYISYDKGVGTCRGQDCIMCIHVQEWKCLRHALNINICAFSSPSKSHTEETWIAYIILYHCISLCDVIMWIACQPSQLRFHAIAPWVSHGCRLHELSSVFTGQWRFLNMKDGAETLKPPAMILVLLICSCTKITTNKEGFNLP